MVVIIAPSALAAVDDTGSMQASGRSGAGSPGDSNRMQAPPSGGPGGNVGQGSVNGEELQELPSRRMGRGNTTAPPGPGDRQRDGNMTPVNFGNMTAGDMQGGPGMNGDDTMTPPDFGNLTAGNLMPREGLHGNNSQTRYFPGNQSFDNTTAPADLLSGGNSGQDAGRQSGSQSSGQDQQVGQQSKEDVIASLISQLHALLSGKK